jgi:hypothetical protein
MRLYLLTRPVALGLAAMALLPGAVWFSARQLNRGAANSVGTLDGLLALAPSALQRVDIARMNLLCGGGLPGTEGVNVDANLAELDEMAARVRSETARHLYRFQAKPAEFEVSEGFFRMLMLAVVLYEDYSVRYNPDRINTPGTLDPNDHFFADSRDLFLHGLLAERSSSPSPSPALNPLPRHSQATAGLPSHSQATAGQPLVAPKLSEGGPPLAAPKPGDGGPAPPKPGDGGSTLNHRLGTCSSLPVLQVAVGRRLGYPLKLVATKGHLFVRWEDARERFNIEAAGQGVNRFADDYYRHWPLEITPAEEQAEGYLKSLTPPEELAVFLSIRGMCLREAGRLPEAAEAFAAAVRLAPTCHGYRVMLASLHSSGSATSTPVPETKPNLVNI